MGTNGTHQLCSSWGSWKSSLSITSFDLRSYLLRSSWCYHSHTRHAKGLGLSESTDFLNLSYTGIEPKCSDTKNSSSPCNWPDLTPILCYLYATAPNCTNGSGKCEMILGAPPGVELIDVKLHGEEVIPFSVPFQSFWLHHRESLCLVSLYVYLFFWWGWGLNSGLCFCKAGVLPLEQCLQSILL
jgi:hypothetical protein